MHPSNHRTCQSCGQQNKILAVSRIESKDVSKLIGKLKTVLDQLPQSAEKIDYVRRSLLLPVSSSDKSLLPACFGGLEYQNFHLLTTVHTGQSYSSAQSQIP